MSNLTLRGSYSGAPTGATGTSPNILTYKNDALTNEELDNNFLALNTDKAPLNNPTFTGTVSVPNISNSSAHNGRAVNRLHAHTFYAKLENSSLVGSYTRASGYTTHAPVNNNTSQIATTEWIRQELASLDATDGAEGHIVPAARPDETIISEFDNQGVLVSSAGRGYKFSNNTYFGVNLGSPTNHFANLYVGHIKAGSGSIDVGTATISATDVGGMVLPQSIALGTEDNVLPSNLASTTLDKAYASTTRLSSLKMNFTFAGATTFAAPTFVALLDNGTVQNFSTANPNTNIDRFIGVLPVTASAGNSVEITVSGAVSGFTNLVIGDEYHLSPNGTLTNTSGTGTIKIGRAISATQLFVYSSTTIDTYVQSFKKIELTDLSTGANASPSGEGAIAYDNTTGIFTFTPTKTILDAELSGVSTAPTAVAGTNTTQIASTEFVKTAIDSLVANSPAALDTLNELATAINNDASFASTITAALATKASLANPTFTGTASAPTPALSSNDTSIATTAFVKATAPPLNDAALTGTPTAPTAANGTDTTQIATTAFVKNAVALGGGASNMDGGVAQTVRSLATHHFDGGGAQA